MDNIHPNLKKEAFLIRFGFPIFILSAIAPLVIVLIILQINLSFDFLRTIFLFFGVLILSVIFLLLYFKLSAKYKQKVQRASNLLYIAKPEKGVIEPEVLMSVWGPIFRIRHKETNVSDFVTFKVEKHSIRKLHSQPVDIYKDVKGIHDVAVVKVRDTYKIAKLQNKKKAEDVISEFSRLKRTMLAFVLFSILILVITQYFHINSIKSDAEFAVKTTRWPTTSGRIIFSQIDEIRIKEGKSTIKGYTAAIRYLYNLNSKEYQSTNIHLAYEPSKDYNRALFYVEKYPPGSTVAVYYNPKDYSFALLETGHDNDILKEIEEVYIVTGAIAGILLLITIIMLLVFRGQEKKAEEFWKA